MTVKELASKMNELMKEGESNVPVYFVEGPVAYPILNVERQPLLFSVISNTYVIALTKDSNSNP